MNGRRKMLLVVLVLLVLLPMLGSIGTVELTIWILLLAAWTWAFLFWAKPVKDGQTGNHV